mmetsp:Transcript_31789/g.44074  ORF Transcript_31789/g.44074 Transcript_31789/m.44074 type:complete len:209 (+) Transcript_31789:660-1286(+)
MSWDLGSSLGLESSILFAFSRALCSSSAASARSSACLASPADCSISLMRACIISAVAAARVPAALASAAFSSDAAARPTSASTARSASTSALRNISTSDTFVIMLFSTRLSRSSPLDMSWMRLSISVSASFSWYCCMASCSSRSAMRFVSSPTDLMSSSNNEWACEEETIDRQGRNSGSLDWSLGSLRSLGGKGWEASSSVMRKLDGA